MSLHLLRDKTAFVTPIRNSGLTESGIYVLDNDNAKDMQHQDVTMMYRVLEQKNCEEVRAGRVYLVNNPYNFTEVDYEGERRLVMHEDNLWCEIEGYDEECYAIEDEADKYPVCTK